MLHQEQLDLVEGLGFWFSDVGFRVYVADNEVCF